MGHQEAGFSLCYPKNTHLACTWPLTLSNKLNSLSPPHSLPFLGSTDRKAEVENSALFVKVTRERDLIYIYSVQNRWIQAVITAGKKNNNSITIKLTTSGLHLVTSLTNSSVLLCSWFIIPPQVKASWSYTKLRFEGQEP